MNENNITQTADIIFYNGCIKTMDDENEEVTSIAVSDGKVLSAGDNDATLKLKGDKTVLFDLNGYHAVPGFIKTDVSTDISSSSNTLKAFVNMIEENYMNGYTAVFLGDISNEQKTLYTEAINETECDKKTIQRIYDDVSFKSEDESIDPSEAVRQRTMEPAEKTHLDKEIGSIKKGNYADMVIFDEDPFRITSVTGRIFPDPVAVVVGGEVIYDSENDYEERVYDMLLNPMI